MGTESCNSPVHIASPAGHGRLSETRFNRLWVVVVTFADIGGFFCASWPGPAEAHPLSARSHRSGRGGPASLIGLETGRRMGAPIGPSRATGRGSRRGDWRRRPRPGPLSLCCLYVRGQETSLPLNGTIDHGRPRKPQISLLDRDAVARASNTPLRVATTQLGPRRSVATSPRSWSRTPTAFGDFSTARAGLTDLRGVSGIGARALRRTARSFDAQTTGSM
jgi:hypothetical protein